MKIHTEPLDIVYHTDLLREVKHLFTAKKDAMSKAAEYELAGQKPIIIMFILKVCQYFLKYFQGLFEIFPEDGLLKHKIKNRDCVFN